MGLWWLCLGHKNCDICVKRRERPIECCKLPVVVFGECHKIRIGDMTMRIARRKVLGEAGIQRSIGNFGPKLMVAPRGHLP